MKLIRLLAGFFVLSMVQYGWAGGPPLVKSFVDEAANVKGDDAKRLNFMRTGREIKNSKLVQLDKAALFGNVMTFTTPDNVVINLNKTREERRSDTDITWFGKTDSGGDAVFSLNGDKISGEVHESNGKIYNIRTLNKRFHVLTEVDTRSLPPEHPTSHPSGSMREK